MFITTVSNDSIDEKIDVYRMQMLYLYHVLAICKHILVLVTVICKLRGNREKVNMDIRELRYFCAIAECENMFKAAELLHVSQPALSKTMKQLQEELEVDLFDHVGRNIVLNANGKHFYSDVVRAIKIIEDSVEYFRSLKGALSGSIYVMVQSARNIVPEFFVAFLKKYPGINLMLSSPGDSNSTSLFRCSFCISDFEIESLPTGFEYIELFKEELALCVSAENPLSYEKDVKIESIAKQTLLTPWNADDILMCDKRIFRDSGAELTNYFECDNTRTLIAMLKANMGVSLMPISSVKTLEQEGIVIRRVSSPSCYRIISLLKNKRQPASGVNDIFETEIINFFKEYSEGTQ